MKLRYTRRALAQLFFILDYIERRSPQGAANVGERLAAAMAILKTQPHIGASTNRQGFRRYVLAPYPYVILYEPKPGEIVIHGVRHGARRPQGWR